MKRFLDVIFWVSLVSLYLCMGRMMFGMIVLSLHPEVAPPRDGRLQFIAACLLFCCFYRTTLAISNRILAESHEEVAE